MRHHGVSLSLTGSAYANRTMRAHLITTDESVKDRWWDQTRRWSKHEQVPNHQILERSRRRLTVSLRMGEEYRRVYLGFVWARPTDDYSPERIPMQRAVDWIRAIWNLV